ncbi:MAG: DMT family transporter [Actinobacteria bacterium]|nr:DMT family transporter [Actinomycetota bacterium]
MTGTSYWPHLTSPLARRAVAALVVAAFVYGATFVVIKSALADIPPVSYVAWRFVIGAVVLLAIALPRGREIWRHGSLTGVALFGGYVLQTSGLVVTSASNSALITGLYVVLTPLLAGLFRRRPPNVWVLGAALVAFVGIFLLTGSDGLTMSRGDLLTLGCAVMFALHIIALARWAPSHPVVPFTAVQLTVTALLAIPFALIVDGPVVPTPSVWGALLVTGLGVGVGAFLLQVWAQTVLGPSTAAVILAAEPAFAVATAWVVLGERLDLRGWVGSALIVLAIFLVVTRQEDASSQRAEALTPAH